MAPARRSSAINRSGTKRRPSSTGGSTKKAARTRSTAAAVRSVDKAVHRRKSVAVVSASSTKKSAAVKARSRRSAAKGGGGSKKTKSVKTAAKRRSSTTSPAKKTSAKAKRSSCPPVRPQRQRRRTSQVVDAAEIEEQRRVGDDDGREKTPVAMTCKAVSPRAIFIDENKATVRDHYGTGEKVATQALKDAWDYLEDGDDSMYHKYVNKAKSNGGYDDDVGDDRASSFREQSRRSNVGDRPPVTTIDEKDRKRKSGGLRRSQSKVKDPNKPKRALNAYMVFMLEVLPKVRKDMPKSSHKQHVKEIGKRWRNMSDVQKKSYSRD